MTLLMVWGLNLSEIELNVGKIHDCSELCSHCSAYNGLDDGVCQDAHHTRQCLFEFDKKYR